jgi:hypothetical protein
MQVEKQIAAAASAAALIRDILIIVALLPLYLLIWVIACVPWRPAKTDPVGTRFFARR